MGEDRGREGRGPGKSWVEPLSENFIYIYIQQSPQAQIKAPATATSQIPGNLNICSAGATARKDEVPASSRTCQTSAQRRAPAQSHPTHAASAMHVQSMPTWWAGGNGRAGWGQKHELFPEIGKNQGSHVVSSVRDLSAAPGPGKESYIYIYSGYLYTIGEQGISPASLYIYMYIYIYVGNITTYIYIPAITYIYTATAHRVARVFVLEAFCKASVNHFGGQQGIAELFLRWASAGLPHTFLPSYLAERPQRARGASATSCNIFASCALSCRHK